MPTTASRWNLPSAIDLVQLDRDHPGFRDPVYRQRRNDIARAATRHVLGAPVAEVAYSAEELGVWSTAMEQLAPLHELHACQAYLKASRRLPWTGARIPQLAEVNRALEPRTGFTLSPVAGLVAPRVFLEHLGQRRFLATQYMRHHSAPLYTPEPDVIHELVGHAAFLSDPEYADLNEQFGSVAKRATEQTAEALIRVYWYTLEFGAVKEGGAVKAIGAGLLSSFGELGRFAREAELRPLDLNEIAKTPYDPTNYQKVIFVAESAPQLFGALRAWLGTLPLRK